MDNSLHVIYGTGPVGCWTARALRAKNIPVRAVNRSGNRPELMPADVEMVAAEAYNQEQMNTAADGASCVYQALNPPYHQWREHFYKLQEAVIVAAQSVNARFVSVENMYMYDSTYIMDENASYRPASKKGKIRLAMNDHLMYLYGADLLKFAALRSSDYYGPGVTGSAFGEMVFGNIVKGKRAQITGSATIKHSVAYIEDVGNALALMGTSREVWGRSWIAPHAPAMTQGEMVALACRMLGYKPRMTVISPFMMKLAGLFIPEAKETVEMMYEFTRPFVIDSTRFVDRFGLQPTPMETGIQRTVEWYKKKENITTDDEGHLKRAGR
jgi:nucleoside-diphosphate-sugar epimerase